jgi:negative regulator of flagellin synthesis FlgM
MKIPGSSGSEKPVIRQSDGLAGDGVVVHKSETLVDRLKQEDAQRSSASADRVSLSSLGSLMRQELSAANIAEERRQKIDSLKQRIKDGTYNPSSEAVAGSVAEEVSLEVLFGGDALRNS